MTDQSDWLPVIQWWLLEDSAISAACDSQIVIGDQAAPQDQYLTETEQTCIVLTELNENSNWTPGSALHGRIEFDLQLQITTISLQSENKAKELSKLIRDKFVSDVSMTYASETRWLRIMGVSRHPIYLADLKQFRDVLTVRGKGWYWL